MQISNDFVVRYLGTSILPPFAKHEVTDALFISIVNTAGAHQQFVDVNRCWGISPETFANLQVLSSLIYLDVSYTRIPSIDVIVSTCKSLKALNLSGLSLSDFHGLHEIDTLEWLGLRDSNVIDISFAEHLLVLRYLDIGGTNVLSLRPLSGLVRLEQLCLDGCKHLLETVQQQQEVRDCLGSLPVLKLLALGEADAPVEFMNLVVSQMPPSFFLQRKYKG